MGALQTTEALLGKQDTAAHPSHKLLIEGASCGYLCVEVIS